VVLLVLPGKNWFLGTNDLQIGLGGHRQRNILIIVFERLEISSSL